MTFVRYSRALWTEDLAKAAKLAKVDKNQDIGSAKPLLKHAKVDEPSSSFSPTLATVSPKKTAEKLSFSRFSHFSRQGASKSDRSDQHGLVGEWKAGVETLLTMSRPKVYPVHEWTSLLDDADRFMKLWADHAAHLGWQSWEIWGVHRCAPRYRFDAMGLVTSLHGQVIKAITAEAAIVETRTSNLLRFYRRLADPLTESERVLIWELM